jgi:hypothetical protein
MRVEQLYGRWHGDATVMVVGTGPSLRVTPRRLYTGPAAPPAIGLNQAWKVADLDYCVTAHPELWQEFERDATPAQKVKTAWVVKRKGPLAKVDPDDPRFYVFDTDPHPREDNLTYVRVRTPGKLYQGRGIQQTAMNLAAHMGAKLILLVGCDMHGTGGDHHGHHQHVQFHGLPPADVYREYRKYTAKVRRVLREELGVDVLTLSPFVGVGHPDEDYHRLCLELGLPKLPAPKDVSAYARKKADL